MYRLCFSLLFVYVLIYCAEIQYAADISEKCLYKLELSLDVIRMIYHSFTIFRLYLRYYSG